MTMTPTREELQQVLPDPATLLMRVARPRLRVNGDTPRGTT
jgi:hypothetical protein